MNKSLFLVVMFLLASFGCVYAETWTASCTGPNFPYSASLPNPITQLKVESNTCDVNSEIFTLTFGTTVFSPSKILQACGFTVSCTDAYPDYVAAMSASTASGASGYCCINGNCYLQGTADSDSDLYLDVCDQNDADQCTAIALNDICQDTSTGSVGLGTGCSGAVNIAAHCKQMSGANPNPTYRSICTKETQHAYKVASNSTEINTCTPTGGGQTAWALCPQGTCPNCTTVQSIGNVIIYNNERNLCDYKSDLVRTQVEWKDATYATNAYMIRTIDRSNTTKFSAPSGTKYDTISDGYVWYKCDPSGSLGTFGGAKPLASTANFNNIDYYCGCNDACSQCYMERKDEQPAGITTLGQWVANKRNTPVGDSYIQIGFSQENKSSRCQSTPCVPSDCALWVGLQDENMLKTCSAVGNTYSSAFDVLTIPTESECTPNALNEIIKDSFVPESSIGNQPCAPPGSEQIPTGTGGSGVTGGYNSELAGNPPLTSKMGGNPDAFACFGTEKFTQIKECCSPQNCINTNNEKYSLGGTQSNILVTYDRIDNGIPTDFVYAYVPKASGYQISKSNIRFPNLNNYTTMEFDLIHNLPEFNFTQNAVIKLDDSYQFSIVKECKSNNGFEPMKWHHFNCSRNPDIQNPDYTIKDFPSNPTYVQIYIDQPVSDQDRFVLDNIYMSNPKTGTAKNTTYCAGEFRKWITDTDDLSMYPYASQNTIPDEDTPQEKTDSILQRFVACDRNPSYEFTGLQCCGDDSKVDAAGNDIVKEYYTDIQDGCWKGSIVRNNTVVNITI